MIQDMINSDNMNSTESTIPNIFKTLHNVCAVHRRDAVQRRMFSAPGDIMINVGDGHWENN